MVAAAPAAMPMKLRLRGMPSASISRQPARQLAASAGVSVSRALPLAR